MGAADSLGQPLVVEQILIAGNEHTRDFVILREMKTKVGDLLDPGKLELDRLRIESLGLFNRVEIRALDGNNSATLLVWVSERWYIFPFPLLFRNERNWTKISYGLGITHYNFRGRNEQLSASFWLGYNPGYDFSYSSPWLLGQSGLFTSLAFSKQQIHNKSPQYDPFDEKHIGVALTLGRRFGYHTYVALGLGYKRLTCEPAFASVTLSPDGTDDLPSVALSASYDTRDLAEYPRRGWCLNASIRKVGLGDEYVDYLRYGFDLRRYQALLGKFSLALRTAGSFSAGTVPVYDRVYLGYSERVRGHFSDVLEGDHRLVAGAELRFTIIPVFYADLSRSAVVLKDYYRNLKFGLNGGIFFDIGTVWFGDRLGNEVVRRGFGAGLHFHLPYGYVLRTEYALDGKLNGEFILDLDVAF